MFDIIKLMVNDGFLLPGEALAIKKTCADLQESPVRIMRSLKVASQSDLQQYFGQCLGLEVLNSERLSTLGPAQALILPMVMAQCLSALPISCENNKLIVGLEDPTDRNVLTQLRFFTDCQVIPVVATAAQISVGLCRIYGLKKEDLKLTTILEQSRGVIGGYEEDIFVHQGTSEFPKSDPFKNESEDSGLITDLSSIESENDDANVEPLLDDSDMEQFGIPEDSNALEGEDEAIFLDVSEDEQSETLEPDSLMSDEQGIGHENELPTQFTLDEAFKTRAIALINSLTVKLMTCKSKTKAIELVNKAMEQLSVEIVAEKSALSIKYQGEVHAITGEWSDVFSSLVKKINRLADED